MFTIAAKMLLSNRTRLCVTIVGLGCLFFLSAAQIGLLVGWINTNSAIIVNANVDLWVMGEHTRAFDYGMPLPRYRVDQVRSVPGVSWAEAMFMEWSVWQCPDGQRISIELVGLDESYVGGPWEMTDGEVASVRLRDSIIVDSLFVKLLGIERLGDEGELYGKRAIVRGLSHGVRTFTASPFVFTSLKNARRFDQRYRRDDITYVLVRCTPGADLQATKVAIAQAIPNIEVLTTSEFAARTVAYWMLETGVGITVVLTAVLGFAVSGLVTSQTLYAITNDNRAHYATLLVVGFSKFKMCGIVMLQSTVLGILGTALGWCLFLLGARASAETPIPLESTTAVSIGLWSANLIVCVVSALIAVRTVCSVDPISVFAGGQK